MNTVLDTLCSDHANFGKLLNIIEQQAKIVATAGTPDFEILNKAIAYLEGYPFIYHHPLEDVLCDRLQENYPSSIGLTDEIVHEHEEIRARLMRFKQLVISVEQGSIVPRSTIVESACGFVESEWAHMERERSELFPLALKSFRPTDWSFIEERLALVEDSLFGRVIKAPFQRLHQLLLNANTREETSSALDRVLS